MSLPADHDTAALAARIAALEAENARLREPEPAKASTGRWRAWVSALCIVVAALLVPVSIVAAWARVQLVDEDSFTATLAPLASDDAVQSLIIDETMDAITAKVDFLQLTSNVIDGVSSLDLPPAATTALGLLKQPAADGLESLVDRAVTRVVTSDAFADVWATATRAAHRALTTAATSDGGGLVVRTDDGVGIQLGAIVERVKQNLTDQGMGVAGLIPAVDRVVIIGTGENLALIRTAYAVSTAVGYWLPLVSLGLFIAGILIARRRSTALLGTGAGLLVGGGSLALGFSIGAVVVGSVASQLDLSPSALAVIYQQVSSGMSHTAAMIAVIGLVVIVLAWVNGRWRGARALRTGVGSLNAGARTALLHRGIDTGAVGTWLYAQRALVRTVIAVLGIVWLLALRPLTVGDIVLVLVVGLLAWWLAELLQRRPDEEAVVATDAAAQSAEAASADLDAAVRADIADDADTLVIEPVEQVEPVDAGTAITAVIDEAPDVEVSSTTKAPPAAKKPRGGASSKR